MTPSIEWPARGRLRKGVTVKRPVHRAAGILAVAVLLAIGGPASAVAAAPARSRPPNPRIVQSLDSVVSAISALRIPGFVVGVTGGGAGRYERAVGMADVGSNQPMTLSTLGCIARRSDSAQRLGLRLFTS